MPKKEFILTGLIMLVQYYDYHLFGFLAANIADYFLPAKDSFDHVIYIYLIMFGAMLTKPLGAIILGKIGDLKGRSYSFRLSLISNMVAAIGIFYLPAYENTKSIIIVFLLLIYRMIVSASASSGADGVRIYIYERMPASWQCSGVAVGTLFAQAGSLLASCSAWFFTLHYFPANSWKLAFLIGAILGLILFIFSLNEQFSDQIILKETENFRHYQDISLWQIIKQNRNLFLLATIIAGAIGGMNQFIIIFFGTYQFKILKLIDQSLMQYYVSLAVILHMIFSLLSGYLADILPRYYVICAGLILSLIASSLLAINLAKQQFNVVIYLILAACLPLITMPALTILKKSINKAVRYRLFSLSHAIGSVCISAPTSLLASYLYHYTALSWLPIIYFINLLLMISCSLYFIRRHQ